MFFFSSRRRHTRCYRDWSSDVCSSDLELAPPVVAVTGFELKLALVRWGNPLTLRLTELEPLIAVTVTVVVPFELRRTVCEVGDSERLKSGGLLAAPAANEAIAVLQLKLKNGLFRL